MLQPGYYVTRATRAAGVRRSGTDHEEEQEMGAGAGRTGYDWGVGGSRNRILGQENRVLISQDVISWVLRALINIVIMFF